MAYIDPGAGERENPAAGDGNARRRRERQQRRDAENRRRARQQRLDAERLRQDRERLEKKNAYIKSIVDARSQIEADIKKIKRLRFFEEEAKQDMEKLRHYLKSETWWQTSQTGELSSLLAAFINVHCDFIFDLLGLVPAPQSSIPALVVSTVKDSITSLIEGDFDYAKLIAYLTEADTLQKYSSATLLIKLSLTFRDYGIGIGKLNEIPVDIKSLRKEVISQLNRIEMEIFNYEMRIKNSKGLEELKRHSIELLNKKIANKSQ